MGPQMNGKDSSDKTKVTGLLMVPLSYLTPIVSVVEVKREIIEEDDNEMEEMKVKQEMTELGEIKEELIGVDEIKKEIIEEDEIKEEIIEEEEKRWEAAQGGADGDGVPEDSEKVNKPSVEDEPTPVVPKSEPSEVLGCTSEDDKDDKGAIAVVSSTSLPGEINLESRSSKPSLTSACERAADVRVVVVKVKSSRTPATMDEPHPPQPVSSTSSTRAKKKRSLEVGRLGPPAKRAAIKAKVTTRKVLVKRKLVDVDRRTKKISSSAGDDGVPSSSMGAGGYEATRAACLKPMGETRKVMGNKKRSSLMCVRKRWCVVCRYEKDFTESIFDQDLMKGFESADLCFRYGMSREHQQLISLLKDQIDLKWTAEPNDIGICFSCYDSLRTWNIFRQTILAAKSDDEDMADLKMNITQKLYHSYDNIARLIEIHQSSCHRHLARRHLTGTDWEYISYTLLNLRGLHGMKIMRLAQFLMSKECLQSFYCRQCEKHIATGLEGFRAHMKEQHREEDLLLPCEICGHDFPYDRIISETHYVLHWISHFYSYTCDQCDARFPSARLRSDHRRLVHHHRKRGYMQEHEIKAATAMVTQRKRKSLSFPSPDLSDKFDSTPAKLKRIGSSVSPTRIEKTQEDRKSRILKRYGIKIKKCKTAEDSEVKPDKEPVLNSNTSRVGPLTPTESTKTAQENASGTRSVKKEIETISPPVAPAPPASNPNDSTVPNGVPGNGSASLIQSNAISIKIKPLLLFPVLPPSPPYVNITILNTGWAPDLPLGPLVATVDASNLSEGAQSLFKMNGEETAQLIFHIIYSYRMHLARSRVRMGTYSIPSYRNVPMGNALDTSAYPLQLFNADCPNRMMPMETQVFDYSGLPNLQSQLLEAESLNGKMPLLGQGFQDDDEQILEPPPFGDLPLEELNDFCYSSNGQFDLLSPLF